jgi:putative NADH-flavin reductase
MKVAVTRATASVGSRLMKEALEGEHEGHPEALTKHAHFLANHADVFDEVALAQRL